MNFTVLDSALVGAATMGTGVIDSVPTTPMHSSRQSGWSCEMTFVCSLVAPIIFRFLLSAKTNRLTARTPFLCGTNTVNQSCCENTLHFSRYLEVDSSAFLVIGCTRLPVPLFVLSRRGQQHPDAQSQRPLCCWRFSRDAPVLLPPP